MKRIAVAHPDLLQKGGAEGVSMNVLESLQEEFNLVLVTYTDPDFEALNQYYGTDVRPEKVEIQLVGKAPSTLHRLLDPRLHTLRMSLFVREVQKLAESFDLVISTYNELPLPTTLKSIQYIHMPQYLRFAESESSNPVISIYDAVCSQMIEYSQKRVSTNILCTNSKWTGSLVEQAYGDQPQVLYPPVDTRGMSDVPWEDREAGFITVGRIVPKKNVLELIDIVEQTRADGHAVHFHIAGPIPETNYAKAVRQRAEETTFVTLEGALSREELLDLICRHRYGLHGMRQEHYGMSVAELVAGGTIPFIPDGGGQREIVDENPALLYETRTEAVNQIDQVLSSRQMQEQLRHELSTSSNQNTSEQFKQKFRSLVRNVAYGSADR